LLMAMAATAMGLFNRAQIENLCSELFQNRKATRHLFQVVQDFSQNFVGSWASRTAFINSGACSYS